MLFCASMTIASGNRRFFLGWTVVLAAALSAFTQVAFFNPVLGVFIPEFQREFGWSRTEISFGATIGTLVAAFIAPYFGPQIESTAASASWPWVARSWR